MPHRGQKRLHAANISVEAVAANYSKEDDKQSEPDLNSSNGFNDTSLPVSDVLDEDPYVGTGGGDGESLEQLMNSKKDRYEHELVIKSIVQALKPLCKSLTVPKQPSIIGTQTMWHLSTKIEGELKSSDTSSLEVALAMHPTPAIGGYPTESALKAIDKLESYDRNLFTGMVGWSDSKGDGEWVVTIRCAEIDNHKATLYAGAGIVAGSIPKKELAETGAKFNTMLNALGIDIKGQDIE